MPQILFYATLHNIEQTNHQMLCRWMAALVDVKALVCGWLRGWGGESSRRAWNVLVLTGKTLLGKNDRTVYEGQRNLLDGAPGDQI